MLDMSKVSLTRNLDLYFKPRISSFFAKYKPAIDYNLEFQHNPSIASPFTVIRTTDNVPYQAVFLNGVLDIAGVESFLNGADGRVSYIANQGFLPNQSQGFQLIQNSFGFQPYIARNGDVLKDSDGNVTLDFNGGNYFMLWAGSSVNHSIRLLTNNSTMFNVFTSQSTESLEPLIYEGNGVNIVGQTSDTRNTVFRHTLYQPQGGANPFDLDFNTQQPTNTKRILSFRRDDSLNDLIESFDGNLNLVDSKTSALKFTTTNGTRLTLGVQGGVSTIYFNSIWNTSLIFDRTLTNTEMSEINDFLKDEQNII
jgi:hypothetical protein